ncbi:tetratricopeptide repeat protein [Stappia indica]|uniref:Tetratricopeptide repeat protein n=1 Tax=Stappia indica TaxID=538381 RepID=A0A857C988_9HYPH|nr:tetratricopeptide repeat protein [Stappia indica]QGZ35072.1 tetratricopeptide repeat protein [Stappia indica]
MSDMPDAARPEPDDPAAVARQGAALRQGRRVDESVRYLSKAMLRHPGGLAIRYELALSLRWQGEHAQSLALVEEILAAEPAHKPALYARVDTLMQARDFDAALEAARQMLARFPGDPAALAKKGEALRQGRRVDESIRHLSEALRRHPDNLPIKHELAVSLHWNGEHAESLVLTEEVLVAAPSHKPALYARVEILTRMKDFAAAAAAGAALSERHPDEWQAQLRHAVALRHAGDPLGARGIIERILARPDALQPQARARLRVEASRCLTDRGEIRAALEAVRAALKEAPGSREAVVQAIQLERFALDHTAALRLCDEGLARWPDDDGIVRQKVTTLMQAGDMTGAQAALAASRHPHADLWIGLDLDLRHFDHARGRLDEQIAKGEGLSPALQRLEIRLLRNEGRADDAHARMLAYWNRNAGSPEAAALVVNGLVSTERIEEAEAFAAGLPDALRDHTAVRRALAHLALTLSDIETSTDLLIEDARHAPSLLDHVRRLVAAAGRWGFGTAPSRAVMARLEHLLAEAEHRLPDFTLGVLRAQVAMGTSAWAELLTRTGRACGQSPRDIQLLALKARAQFETEEFARSLAATETVLSHNPADVAALKLRHELFFVFGDAEGGAAFLIEQICSGALPAEHWIWMARYIPLVDRLTGLREWIARHAALQSPDVSNATRLARYFLRHEDDPTRLAPSSYPRYRPLSGEDLHDLFAAAEAGQSEPGTPSAAGLIAWQLQGEARADRAAWLARAQYATYLHRVIGPRNVCRDARLAFERSDAFAELEERMRSRVPTLIVGTHLGIGNLIFRGSYFQNTAFLVSSVTRHEDLNSNYEIILPTDRLAAARIVKCLKGGMSVFSTPDFPAEANTKAGFRSEAAGSLFGVRCTLLDTVPKVAQALGVPIYWMQALRSGTDVRVDVRRMADALPDEDTDSWAARWAQDYLDLLAGVMTSGADNQNFSSVMYRYLMLKKDDLSLARHNYESTT